MKKIGAKPGVDHPLAKLNDDTVREIRARYPQGGVTILSLACDYDVNPSTIWSALRRRTWRHVEDNA